MTGLIGPTPFSALKSRHLRGVSRRAVHPSLAHAPQSRHDCMASDESWQTINELLSLILGAVCGMCLPIERRRTPDRVY